MTMKKMLTMILVIGTPWIAASEQADQQRETLDGLAIEQWTDWGERWELTAYYPSREIMMQAQKFITRKELEVTYAENEILFFKDDQGRHILTISFPIEEGRSNFYCLCYDRKDKLRYYWIQESTADGETEILESGEVADAGDGI